MCITPNVNIKFNDFDLRLIVQSKINITFKVRIILIWSLIQYTSHFRSVIDKIRRCNVKYLPTPLS